MTKEEKKEIELDKKLRDILRREIFLAQYRADGLKGFLKRLPVEARPPK